MDAGLTLRFELGPRLLLDATLNELKLVEAPGVEPGSESTSTQELDMRLDAVSA